MTKSLKLKQHFMKKSVSKDQISIPTDFEHVFHTNANDAKKYLEELDDEMNFGESSIRVKPAQLGKRSKSTLPWIGSRDDSMSDDEIEETFHLDNNYSEKTEEKVVVTKLWMENYFERLAQMTNERGQRKERLEQQLNNLGLSDEKKEDMRKKLSQKETDYTRLRRTKISVDLFEDIKIIGRGAFGVVKLIREKSTGQLFAMKVIQKSDMIKRRQEGHVRAERDILAIASHLPGVVRLYLSFQDKMNLYFVLEYMAGGDLLNLLIKKDIFAEDFAKFYIAEMILCIGQVHSLGYIHRDIKPDNFLFNAQGHINISDFGLCTGFHWAHDAKFYQAQRRIALRRMGEAQAEGSRTDLFDDNVEPKDKVLIWREKHKRSLAYSVVGTNNYIAPEVLLQVGYNKLCDWWSLGVILFEMLFGYPPFCAEDRQITKFKIINWQQSLKFPRRPTVSKEAKDLIKALLCDPSDRLGKSTDEIKQHPFFNGVEWDKLYSQTPPWAPALKSPTDTSHFDDIHVSNQKIPVSVETDYDLFGFTFRGFEDIAQTEKDKGKESLRRRRSL